MRISTIKKKQQPTVKPHYESRAERFNFNHLFSFRCNFIIDLGVTPETTASQSRHDDDKDDDGDQDILRY